MTRRRGDGGLDRGEQGSGPPDDPDRMGHTPWAASCSHGAPAHRPVCTIESRPSPGDWQREQWINRKVGKALLIFSSRTLRDVNHCEDRCLRTGSLLRNGIGDVTRRG
jgi:hypothetical protein